jgi:hypothetical protein
MPIINKENKKILVFQCANRECKCLLEGAGLYFFTCEPKKAEEHSRENHSPMWIEWQSFEQFLGMAWTWAQIEALARKNDG